jgi:hypothetical protein
MTLFGRAPKESKLPTGQEQQFSSFGTRAAAKGEEEDLSSLAKSQPSPRIEIKKPLLSQKPLTPPKPKTLFEEKKDWTRSDFLRKATKDSFGSGGKMRSSYEREKILKEALPVGRFGTYISDTEVKTKLRELRSKEYYAKGEEKAKLKETRKNLEKGSGLAGKY